MTLFDRIERATPDMQADLLREVWEASNPRPPSYSAAANDRNNSDEFLMQLAKQNDNWWAMYRPFSEFLTARAYVDAALSLWPDGKKLRQMNFSAPCADDRKWHLNIHGGKEGELRIVGRSSTPALALLAAIVRATGKDRTNDQ